MSKLGRPNRHEAEIRPFAGMSLSWPKTFIRRDANESRGIGGRNKIRTNDLGVMSFNLTVTPRTRKWHPLGYLFDDRERIGTNNLWVVSSNPISVAGPGFEPGTSGL